MRPTVQSQEDSALETYAEIKLGEIYFAWYLMGCFVVSLLLVFLWNTLEKIREWFRQHFNSQTFTETDETSLALRSKGEVSQVSDDV